MSEIYENSEAGVIDTASGGVNDTASGAVSTPRPIQLVHCTGATEDGLLSYNYVKKAKYGLKLPERNEEIFLPNAEAVGSVLLESGRQKITKWTVYDYFNTRRIYGQRLKNKLEGAILRKL